LLLHKPPAGSWLLRLCMLLFYMQGLSSLGGYLLGFWMGLKLL
jgi:hypothetical protein